MGSQRDTLTNKTVLAQWPENHRLRGLTHAPVMDVAHHTDDLQPGRVGAGVARDPFPERRGRTAVMTTTRPG